MLDRVENRMIVLEGLRYYLKSVYHISAHNPCFKNRKKAKWEKTKAELEIKIAQRQYVSLCDQVMTDTQLYEFLKTQNIQILFK